MGMLSARRVSNKVDAEPRESKNESPASGSPDNSGKHQSMQAGAGSTLAMPASPAEASASAQNPEESPKPSVLPSA